MREVLSTSSWLDLSLCLHHPPSAAQARTSLPRPRVSLCVSFAVCVSIGLSMSLHHRGRDHDHQPRHASETAVRVPSLLLPPFLPPPLPLCIAVCLPACHSVCPCTYLARVRARGPAWRGARRRSPSQRARRVARLPQPPTTSTRLPGRVILIADCAALPVRSTVDTHNTHTQRQHSAIRAIVPSDELVSTAVRVGGRVAGRVLPLRGWAR